MTVLLSEQRAIQCAEDVVSVRQMVRQRAVELGLSLSGVRTALNVDRGMALISQRADAVEGGDDRAEG